MSNDDLVGKIVSYLVHFNVLFQIFCIVGIGAASCCVRILRILFCTFVCNFCLRELTKLPHKSVSLHMLNVCEWHYIYCHRLVQCRSLTRCRCFKSNIHLWLFQTVMCSSDDVFMCNVYFLQQHSSVCLQIAAALCITNLIDKNDDGKQFNYRQELSVGQTVSITFIRAPIFMSMLPDTVCKGIMFLGCPSAVFICPFVRADRCC